MKKIAIFICFCIFIGCKQKCLEIITSKAGVSVKTIEPYDKESYQILKTCKGVKVKVIHVKKVR